MSEPAATPALLLRRARELHSARVSDPLTTLTAGLMGGDLFGKHGELWNGPLPRTGPSRDRADLTREIERTFVSRNLARDIVRRHRSGVAGREPLWNVTSRAKLPKGTEMPAALAALAAEFNDALSDWWDDSGAWLAMQKALDNALALGTGTVRFYIHEDQTEAYDTPSGVRRVIPAGLGLTAAMNRISFHAPRWDQAGVTRDMDGHVTGAYYTREPDASLGVGERWELQERIKTASGTITRVWPDTNDAGAGSVDYPVPDLMLYELRLDPLITNSVRRLLQMANKSLTMGSRNVDLGGFLERTILNGQMPGKTITMEDGTKVFEAGQYNVGAGTTNFLSGKPVYAEDPENPGRMKATGNFTTPSIVYKDPSAFTVFGDTFNKAREMILDEASQLHVMITGDASASGVSRQQAVNDFISSLEPTRMALEQLVRWVLSTVLKLALNFVGRAGAFDDLRVIAQARLSAVQPTSAEIDTALKLRQAGAISRETFHAKVGVEDSAAEAAQITAEGITPELVTAISAAGAPGWVVLKAMSMAWPQLGISSADVADAKAAETAPPVLPTMDLNADTAAKPDAPPANA